jgi:nucleotide-binding universal stress UspA family protein
MRHIILPTDFSDNAWKAMNYAANLYHKTPCTFHIINTYSLPTAFAGTGGVTLPINTKPMEKESENHMEELLKEFKDLEHHGLSDFEVKCASGPVIVAIQNLEDELDTTPVIVMGTKGVTGADMLFFGTVTTSVIKRCNSPVICVPTKANLGIPKNIMFAMDDLIISSKIEIQPLIELAEEWDSKIATVHINNTKMVSTGKTPKEIVSDYYLDRIEHSYHSIEGVSIEGELMNFADENHIDLIAMTKREQGFWKSFFQTSLTKNMAFYSKIPLLVLKEL